jgi:hypothetical protein
MHVQISKTSKFLARSTLRELTNFVLTVGCKYVPRLLSTGRHKDQVNYMSKFGKWRNFVWGDCQIRKNLFCELRSARITH